MSFVADDLGAWLVGTLADAGRKRLTTLLLGTEQQRALRHAATVAVSLAAGELRPEGGVQAESLAMVVSQVFSEPVPDNSLSVQTTVLEALQEGIGRQLAVLDDVTRTGTGQSSAEVLGLSTSSLVEKLVGHLVREIVIQGSRGGPLEPLAAQLNHDVTHLQVHRLMEMFGQLSAQVREGLARLEAGKPVQPSALGVRYSLPPDAAAFTGRDEELDRITAAIANATWTGGLVAIHAIDGMPGVGKTALAVHAAHLLRHRFADRQLFVNLHAHTPGQDPVSPETALAGLLRAIGTDPRYLPGDLEGRTEMWRDRMAGQRALLVLDNAASSAQVIPLLPGGDGCLVLVTSRRHLADLQGAVVPILLEVLPPAKAQEMFLRLALRASADPDKAVAELVRQVGFLPLAISLLARVYARHPSWTLKNLTAETKARMLTLTAENASVAAAFEMSYRYLPSDQQEFFRGLALHLGTTTDDYAAAALTGTGLHKAGECLDALHGEGLLTETSYNRYGMHDLIRRYARGRAADDPGIGREQALERLLDYYQHTATIAEALLAQKTRTRRPLVAVPTAVPQIPDSSQALAWARVERANLVACLDYAIHADQHARVVALTAAMAALLRRDGPWTDAITRHAAAVLAAEHLDDQAEQANALSNLGIVRRLTGDYPAAAQALEEAAEIYRGLGDCLGQASVLSEQGAVRYLTDDCPGAAQGLEESLSIFRDLGDRPGQAYALIYLGIVRQVTGDYPSAAQALEEALEISRDLGDRLGEAYALIYLGVVRRLIGDYSGAAQVLEEALSNARDTGHRIGQVGPLTYLGAVRQDTGDYPGSAQVLQDALDISRHLGDRLGQAYALSYLGALRRLTGDYPGSAQALQEALDISRDIGAQDSEVTALNEAGTLHRVRGDLVKARECHLHALNLARETASSWEEAQALAGLGRCALATDRTADAETSLQQARQIFQRIGAAEAAHISAELEAITTAGPAA